MMFFGYKHTFIYYKKIMKGKVLQTRHHEQSYDLYSKIGIRRISSTISCKRASMTIETAFALPIFMLGMLMIISVIEMMTDYTKNEEKLFEQTRQLAVHAGVVENNFEGLDNDYIDLSIPHILSPKIKGPGFKSILTVNHCKARVWNGYHATGEGTDYNHKKQYVYVTQQGSVYHKTRSCSHLNITIQQTNANQIKQERNEDGSKYKVCPECAKGLTAKELKQYVLYITPYGDRYHISLRCSKLKRSIQVVPLDEVTGKAACSDCG